MSREEHNKAWFVIYLISEFAKKFDLWVILQDRMCPNPL